VGNGDRAQFLQHGGGKRETRLGGIDRRRSTLTEEGCRWRQRLQIHRAWWCFDVQGGQYVVVESRGRRLVGSGLVSHEKWRATGEVLAGNWTLGACSRGRIRPRGVGEGVGGRTMMMSATGVAAWVAWRWGLVAAVWCGKEMGAGKVIVGD
jgi:hypothetical protein